VLLVQVPAARAHDQHGLLGLRAQRVLLAVVAAEGQRAGDRLAQRLLAGQQVGPGRRRAVLEVGHVAVGAGVQRVDHHLRVDRPGDLHPAVLQRRRDRGDAPVGGADRCGVGAEIRQRAGIEGGLAGAAGGQAGLAFASKRTCRPARKVCAAGVSSASWPGRLRVRSTVPGSGRSCSTADIGNSSVRSVGNRTIRLRLVFDKPDLSMISI
jgi:hypothetical protein